MKRLATCASILAAVGFGPSWAAAQPSAEDLAQAQAHWERGAEALAAQRWVEARDAFAASYALVQHHRTLFNLAAAQAETNQLLEAVESYEAYLEQADAEHRDAARASLAELQPRVPRWSVQADLHPGDQLLVDDEPVTVGQAIVRNPGPVRVTIVRDNEVIAERVVELREGSQPATELAVPPLPPNEVALAEDLTAPDPDADPVSSSVLESPWFWIITTAVVAAGLMAGGILLFGPSETVGNFGSGRWDI